MFRPINVSLNYFILWFEKWVLFLFKMKGNFATWENCLILYIPWLGFCGKIFFCDKRFSVFGLHSRLTCLTVVFPEPSIFSISQNILWPIVHLKHRYISVSHHTVPNAWLCADKHGIRSSPIRLRIVWCHYGSLHNTFSSSTFSNNV